MRLFHNLFGNKVKKNPEKDEAIALADYESWYYSLNNLYKLKPDIQAWRKELEESYNLKDVLVFGDFSNKGIREELTKIRCVTNSIIETQQSINGTKKDMTDFIMLDYIYQCVNDYPNINTYVLFTGDAHFQSVINYLIQKRNKKVIVYGVKDAFSNQLKNIATKAIEVPAADEILQSFYPIIVENMSYVSEKSAINPTFSATARILSTRNNVPEDLIKAAIAEMLRKGLLYTREKRVDFNQSVPVLRANWDKLVEVGLWSY